MIAACLAAAPFVVAMPASAQTDVQPPQPFDVTDQFGVSFMSGTVQVTSPTISIGPEQGGLSFNATWDGRARAWRYSQWGGINKDVSKSDPQCRLYYTVTMMGQSATFQRDGCTGPFDRIDGLGTLVRSGNTYTYTAPDGTVASYNYASRIESGYYVANQGLLTSITKPNGEVITYTYFGGGLIQSVTNNLGYQIHFQYAGSVLSKVTAVNNAITPCAPTSNSCTFPSSWPSLTFTTTGLERHVTDNLGRVTRIIFDSTDPLIARVVGVARPTRSSGASVTYTHAQVRPRGIVVTSASDGVGTWSYDYEGWACPPLPDPCPPPDTQYDLDTTVTDPNGNDAIYNFTWDYRPFSEGQTVSALTAMTNGEGDRTLMYQDGAGLAYATYPEGNGITVTRETTGAVSEITESSKPGSGLPRTSTVFTYPACTGSNPIACRRPTSVTDPRGNATAYTYDAAGNVLTQILPAPTTGAVQPQTRFVYEQRNAWYKQNGSASITQNAASVWVPVERSECATLASCDGTADEVLTTTTYQVGGSSAASNILPLTVSVGAGNASASAIATTTTTYDDVRNVLTVNGPLSGAADTTRYVYDNARQQVGVIGPDPDGSGGRLFPATRTTFNLDGQATSVEQGTTTGQTNANWTAFSPLQTASTVYNAQARKTRDTLAAGTAAASQTDYAYDNGGRLTCTAQRMNPTTFGGAANDACALLTTGGFGPDRITHNIYDAANRLTQVQTGYASGDPLIERLQSWTSNGQVDWIEDGAGNRSDYAYDGFDRLYRLYFPSTTVGAHAASTTDYEQYGYDANDNPTTKRTRANTTFTTAFDTLNRITSIDAPSGSNDVWYRYDNLNRRLSASHASGTPNCTTTAVCTTWDALGRPLTEQSSLGTMTSAYDLAGRRTQLTWPDAVFVTYQYDLDDLMVGIKLSNVTSIITYAYDNLGRRTTATRGNGVVTSYGYDAASRLTSLGQNPAGTASDITYAYTHNPASQVVTLGRSNSGYAYTGVTGQTVYGNNGLNQTTSLGGTPVTWSAQGNLTNDGTRTYTYDAANRMTGTGSSTLSYDPLDRLARMVGTTGGRYLYDGSQIAGVVTAASGTAINNRLIYGPRPDELVVAYQGSGTGTPLWTLQDHLGSSIAITDTTGVATYTMAYDEYGAPRSGNAGRLQYTGQLWLPDFSTYSYKARIYRPDLGRFVQTDPVGYAQGLNLYAYVGNDPVNGTDPTGMVTVLKNGAIASYVYYAGSDGSGGPDGDPRGPGSPPIPNAPPEAERAAASLQSRTGLGLALTLCGDTPSACSTGRHVSRWYVTYTKHNPLTGMVYSGRASGYGSPAQVLARRDSGHEMNARGYGPATIDRAYGARDSAGQFTGYAAYRGREQMLINYYADQGICGNCINGIGPRNRAGPFYVAVATMLWGRIGR